MRLVATHQTTIQLYPDTDQPTRTQNHNAHGCRFDLVHQTIGIALLIIAFSLMGCAEKARTRSIASSSVAARGVDRRLGDTDSRPCVGWPKRLAFLFDQTGSTQKTRTEHPSLDSLNDVVECAKRHGGSIYAGTIRDRSNQTFAHLSLEPEPIKPKDTDLTGNALIDVDRVAAQAQVMDGYEKRHQVWAARSNEAIEAFRRSAGCLLVQSANAPATDLVTAVERAYVALDEPTPFPWLAKAPRMLIVVTDGADTVTRRHVPAAGFPLVLIIVNGNGLTGDLGHLRPLRFESVDSMLTYVTGGRHV